MAAKGRKPLEIKNACSDMLMRSCHVTIKSQWPIFNRVSPFKTLECIDRLTCMGGCIIHDLNFPQISRIPRKCIAKSTVHERHFFSLSLLYESTSRHFPRGVTKITAIGFSCSSVGLLEAGTGRATCAGQSEEAFSERDVPCRMPLTGMHSLKHIKSHQSVLHSVRTLAPPNFFGSQRRGSATIRERS